MLLNSRPLYRDIGVLPGRIEALLCGQGVRRPVLRFQRVHQSPQRPAIFWHDVEIGPIGGLRSHGVLHCKLQFSEQVPNGKKPVRGFVVGQRVFLCYCGLQVRERLGLLAAMIREFTLQNSIGHCQQRGRTFAIEKPHGLHRRIEAQFVEFLMFHSGSIELAFSQ